jgi:hypothetical protein
VASSTKIFKEEILPKKIKKELSNSFSEPVIILIPKPCYKRGKL